MQTMNSAWWPLKKPRADVDVGLCLGAATPPSLPDLGTDECVMPVEPNELQAAGTLRKITHAGRERV